MADPKPNTSATNHGGPWFVFIPTGTIQRQDNAIAAWALVAAGWVGFATKAEAEDAAHHYSVPAVAGQAESAVSGAVTDTQDFLSRLTSPQLWIRVAEVVLGLLLIAVGISKLTGAVPAATRVAKTIGSVA